jgi:hypothetical protein
MENKKGQISGLTTVITTLILIGIVLGLAFLILGKLKDIAITEEGGDYGYGTTASNATDRVMYSLADIPNIWLQLIVTVVIIGIVLAIVTGIFSSRKAQ